MTFNRYRTVATVWVMVIAGFALAVRSGVAQGGETYKARLSAVPADGKAQALRETKNIRIGPGGFLLPYHHPAELANRVAMLDHLSDGRFA